MEMSLSCCIGCHLLFHLLFSSRPSACPACIALSHLSRHFLKDTCDWWPEPYRLSFSWPERHISWADGRCALNPPGDMCVYISTAWSDIHLNTDSEQNTDYCVFQLVLSNPQQWMIYEKTKGEDFYRKFTCWSMLLLNSYSCHMRLYHISKEFLQRFIFGWVLMAL